MRRLMKKVLFCGIDLGSRASSVCIVDVNKRVIKKWSGKTGNLVEEIRERCPEMHCVVEASPLAESICAEVEKSGGSIEIIDSKHTKALLNGKKKTDRIDALTLAELAQMGWYKPIYRKEGSCRDARTELKARAQVVKSGTSLKNAIRGLLKAYGIVLPQGGDGMDFVKRVKAVMEELSLPTQTALKELLQCWMQLHRTQVRMYRSLTQAAKKDEVASIFTTVPGVGPATAIAFASTIATHTRFKDKKKVASYVGLAPRVYQSGETSYHGRITKQGDSLLRWLLIESAHVMLTRVKKSFPLREWGLKLAERKGFAKAKVAVARKIAELLFTLWQRQKSFVVA